MTTHLRKRRILTTRDRSTILRGSRPVHGQSSPPHQPEPKESDQKPYNRRLKKKGEKTQ
jgi:hypothetical protein